jgi:glycosyltransferase involved in cell wall biosynthesis
MKTDRTSKVGIFFNARPEQGGLYQYALTLIDCLKEFVPEHAYYLYHATLAPLPVDAQAANWQIVHLRSASIKWRMAIEYLIMLAARIGLQVSGPLIPEYKEIQKHVLDLMIYVKPTPHVFQWDHPAIFPIHDLQHRLQPEFPEVSEHGEYRRREYLYIHSIRKARAILTDSVTGREDVMAAYGVGQEKIFPLPYIAPTFRLESTDPDIKVDLRRKYGLPDIYLFYPAAFWAHKNHLRLVRALFILSQENGIRIPIAFAGARSREYEKVAALVGELNMTDIVHFLGYVPDDDLTALYRGSLALVMPTFFGPTNIPILEAWANDCPVITSDVRGIREQVADAGLLIDPRNETELAGAIWKVYQSPELRAFLIERGKARIAQWTPELFARGLAEVIKFVMQGKSIRERSC